jgi:hypothetical protein
MKASEFDKKFDEGENIIDQLDKAQIRNPELEIQRVQISLPVWLIKGLDREARRLGVTRQSVIKMWLAERLEQRAQ